MSYVFLRRFNPAYGYFLIRYFKKEGIDFDENAPCPLPGRESFHLSRSAHGESDRLFESYLARWRAHPAVRPDYLELFERIPDTPVNPGSLTELEEQLPNGKIVFSLLEVSSSVAIFYRRHVDKRHPARLENDARPTQGEISSEITQALVWHRKDGSGHLRRAESVPDGPTLWSCLHSSTWIQLACFGGTSEDLTMFVEPSKGYDNAVYERASEWNLIGFPSFKVIRKS